MTKPLRAPTMQDIARDCGVSQATVSLVLNSVAGVRVSDQTRNRVIEVAEKLGYRRSLRLRAHAREAVSIGLIIDDLAASPFAVPLLEGARDAAWEEEYVVDAVSTRNHAPMEAAAIENMLRRPLAGIIYAALITRQVTPPIVPNDVPVILLNCYDADGAFTSVVPDDETAAFELTSLLVRAGHRRIAHLSGEPFIDAGRDRLAGYRAALEKGGIAFDERLVSNRGSALASGYEGADRLLADADPPTALFCFNDRMALGALEAARDHGLAIPGDLSIVGFDNDPLVLGIFPNLTTAELPHEAMARFAVQQVLERRQGRWDGIIRQVKLPCPLARRKSTLRHGMNERRSAR